MRTPTHAPLSIEDIAVGDELPRLVMGPITPSHLMRWAAAMENWHRIHFDRRYAIEHDGLPDVVVNGSWKQHVLMQLVTDWAGEAGWLWRIAFQFRAINVPGETLTAWGRVTALEQTRRLRAGDARRLGSSTSAARRVRRVPRSRSGQPGKDRRCPIPSIHAYSAAIPAVDRAPAVWYLPCSFLVARRWRPEEAS